MATLSFADLKNTALPSLWDGAEMSKVALADGSTFDQVVGQINAALMALNGSMLDMPHYGSLISVQDDIEIEYPVGVSNGVQVAGEYSVPDPKRGATTGHSLPIVPYERAAGWTMMYLRKARRAKLDADVRSMVVDIRNNWQQKILQRFFKMEGETVGTTSNASVPFADGGVTDSTYVPIDSPDGESFTSSHDHFLRHTAIDATNLAATVETLQEHGYLAPFDIIGSRADAATWSGITGWKAPDWPGIVYHASATERANVQEVTNYFGYIETDYGICRVWLTPRVPTAYYGLYKAYPAGDPRNALRVRIDQNTGFGWRLVPGNWVNAPMLLAAAYSEWGVGVGMDRTNGVCVEIDASGDYATPTIS